MGDPTQVCTQLLSKRKRAQREISRSGVCPQTEGFGIFPKSDKKLSEFYLNARHSKLEQRVKYVSEDLIQRMSELQTHCFEDRHLDDADAASAVISSAADGPPRADDASQTPQGGIWDVALVKTSEEEAAEEFARYQNLRDKTRLSYDGIRVLSLPTEITCNLSKIDRFWFRRGLFKTKMSRGLIRVLSGPFPPKGYKIKVINSTRDFRANPSALSLNDLIYVRHQVAYWYTRGDTKGGDGWLIPEIPPHLITPLYREGFLAHMREERAEDENASGKATPESLSRLQDSCSNVEAWIHEDPEGHAGTLPIFIASRALKVEDTPALVTSDANDAEMVNLEHLDSNIDPLGSKTSSDTTKSCVEPPAPPQSVIQTSQSQPPVSTAPQGSLAQHSPSASIDSSATTAPPNALDPKALEFLIDNPFKCEGYLQEAKDMESECLKLKPNLSVAVVDGSSKSSRTLSSSSSQSSSETQWYTPKDESLAAKKTYTFMCPYPYCRNSTYHLLITCEALHQRCAKCRCRGHDDQVAEIEGRSGIYDAQCPVVANANNEGTTPTVFSPRWQELLDMFENFASQGALTRYRFHSAGAGFYPAKAEGDLEIIKAIGYKWLLRLGAERALTLLGSIHRQCYEAFGEESLRYSDQTDDTWTTVFQQRDTKRTHKRDSKDANLAKIARQQSPNPREDMPKMANAANLAKDAKQHPIPREVTPRMENMAPHSHNTSFRGPSYRGPSNSRPSYRGPPYSGPPSYPGLSYPGPSYSGHPPNEGPGHVFPRPTGHPTRQPGPPFPRTPGAEYCPPPSPNGGTQFGYGYTPEQWARWAALPPQTPGPNPSMDPSLHRFPKIPKRRHNKRN